MRVQHVSSQPSTARRDRLDGIPSLSHLKRFLSRALIGRRHSSSPAHGLIVNLTPDGATSYHGFYADLETAPTYPLRLSGTWPMAAASGHLLFGGSGSGSL